jgi:L-rhamnose-H+ transport protein
VDKLGLALGYPIIMGLNASLGAVIPLAFLVHRDASTAKVATVIVGTTIALAGIVVCSVAGSRKETQKDVQPGKRAAFTAGLMIAVASGILSGLPNVGMAYAVNVVKAAKSAGASDALAGNAVWALFFTLGAIVNIGYCGWLMVRRKNVREFFSPDSIRNLALGSVTALMWIGSFYLYGISAPLLGSWGAVIGWPVFISVAIGVGSLAGLWKGEWKRAPAFALRLLGNGLLLILVAVVTLAAANAM